MNPNRPKAVERAGAYQTPGEIMWWIMAALAVVDLSSQRPTGPLSSASLRLASPNHCTPERSASIRNLSCKEFLKASLLAWISWCAVPVSSNTCLQVIFQAEKRPSSGQGPVAFCEALQQQSKLPLPSRTQGPVLAEQCLMQCKQQSLSGFIGKLTQDDSKHMRTFPAWPPFGNLLVQAVQQPPV